VHPPLSSSPRTFFSFFTTTTSSKCHQLNVALSIAINLTAPQLSALPVPYAVPTTLRKSVHRDLFTTAFHGTVNSIYIAGTTSWQMFRQYKIYKTLNKFEWKRISSTRHHFQKWVVFLMVYLFTCREIQFVMQLQRDLHVPLKIAGLAIMNADLAVRPPNSSTVIVTTFVTQQNVVFTQVCVLTPAI
jgi:hypothetical protein